MNVLSYHLTDYHFISNIFSILAALSTQPSTTKRRKSCSRFDDKENVHISPTTPSINIPKEKVNRVALGDLTNRTSVGKKKDSSTSVGTEDTEIPTRRLEFQYEEVLDSSKDKFHDIGLSYCTLYS